MNYLKSALMLALITGGVAVIFGGGGDMVLRILVAIVVGLIFEAIFWYRAKKGLSGHEEWIWGTAYGRIIRRLEVKWQNYLDKKGS